MTNLLSNRLFILVLLFATAQLIGWVFHLLLLSITAFFHFQLDHSLRSVDQWVVAHGWYLVVLTKLGAVTSFWFFLRPDVSVKSAVADMFSTRHHLIPSRESGVLLLFMAIFIIWPTRPVLNDVIARSYWPMFISYCGLTIYYLVDLAIYQLLVDRFFIDQRNRIHHPPVWVLIILAMISTFSLKASYGHLKQLDYYLWSGLFFTFFLIRHLQKNFTSEASWWSVLPFILLIFAPTGAILGFDPLWQGEFSLFIATSSTAKFQTIIMIAVSVSYLWLIQYRKAALRRHLNG